MPYQPKPIVPPWKGIVDDVPSILAPSSSFSTCQGFWVEKQRLRSVPPRTALTAPPVAGGILTASSSQSLIALGYALGDIVTVIQGSALGGLLKLSTLPPPHPLLLYPALLNPGLGYTTASGLATSGGSGAGLVVNITAATTPSPVIGERSFFDANGNLHTILITASAAFYYVGGVYTPIAAFSSSPSLTPLKTEFYQNTIICTNGSDAPLQIDGSALATEIALPNNGTCFFLGTLAQRMLYLYIVEPIPSDPSSAAYPARIRWSQVNNANNFTDFTAGVADLPDVDDNITGYALQGGQGYIYHNTGIITIEPTGGISPTFITNSYTKGRGLGNWYPYSLAQYGNLTCFVAQSEINSFNPLLGPPTPIGGSATRSIFTDLQQAVGNVVGAIIPTYGAERQGLQYWLAIPLVNNTSIVWMYAFDSQSWTKQLFPFAVTCIEVIATS